MEEETWLRGKERQSEKDREDVRGQGTVMTVEGVMGGRTEGKWRRQSRGEEGEKTQNRKQIYLRECRPPRVLCKSDLSAFPGTSRFKAWGDRGFAKPGPLLQVNSRFFTGSISTFFSNHCPKAS